MDKNFTIEPSEGATETIPNCAIVSNYKGSNTVKCWLVDEKEINQWKDYNDVGVWKVKH